MSKNRGRKKTRGKRYATNLRDADWVLIEPMLPQEKSGGRKRTTSMRSVVNGILYIARAALAAPAVFPAVGDGIWVFCQMEADWPLATPA